MSYPYQSCLTWRYFIGMVSLSLLSYFFFDQWLALEIAKLPKAFILFNDKIGYFIKGKLVLPILFLSLPLAYFIRPQSNLWRHILLLLFILGAMHLCLSITKPIFGRMRPMLFIEHGQYGFVFLARKAQYWSFPSGHTALVFTIFAYLSSQLKAYRYLFWMLAALLALSRVFSLNHYLSDVMMTAYLSLAFIPLTLQFLGLLSQRFVWLQSFSNIWQQDKKNG